MPSIEYRVERRELTPRPPHLSGMRLGFFDSYGSRNADGTLTMYPLMAELRPLLETMFELAGVTWRKKPNIAQAATLDFLDEFAGLVDVAVVGECASGSSVYATIHDAVELEQRGIPTITICHDQLEAAARRHSRELGIANLSLLIEPAAGAGIVARQGPEFAGSVLDQVVRALTQAGGA